MSFSFKIPGDTKAEAKESLVKLRHAQPQSVPHPLVELALTALDGIREDGPVLIEAFGHLATEDSYQVSEAHLRVGKTAQLSEANSGAGQPGPAIAKLEEQLKAAKALAADYADTIDKQRQAISSIDLRLQEATEKLGEATALAADQAKLIEAQKVEIENLTAPDAQQDKPKGKGKD